jgi:hypothetical protein
MKKIYVFNTLITPIDFSKFNSASVNFERVSVEDVKAILSSHPFISAIGHEGTAQLLSKILGVQIPANRVSVFLEPGDIGIHFFLKQRLPEGKVLSEEELKNLDFWLVLSEVKE